MYTPLRQEQGVGRLAEYREKDTNAHFRTPPFSTLSSVNLHISKLSTVKAFHMLEVCC